MIKNNEVDEHELKRKSPKVPKSESPDSLKPTEKIVSNVSKTPQNISTDFKQDPVKKEKVNEDPLLALMNQSIKEKAHDSIAFHVDPMAALQSFYNSAQQFLMGKPNELAKLPRSNPPPPHPLTHKPTMLRQDKSNSNRKNGHNHQAAKTTASPYANPSASLAQHFNNHFPFLAQQTTTATPRSPLSMNTHPSNAHHGLMPSTVMDRQSLLASNLAAMAAAAASVSSHSNSTPPMMAFPMIPFHLLPYPQAWAALPHPPTSSSGQHLPEMVNVDDCGGDGVMTGVSQGQVDLASAMAASFYFSTNSQHSDPIAHSHFVASHHHQSQPSTGAGQQSPHTFIIGTSNDFKSN